MKTKAVLLELFELLEAYAPSWYSEEQRDRAIAALKYTDKPGLQLMKPSARTEPARNRIPVGQSSLIQ